MHEIDEFVMGKELAGGRTVGETFHVQRDVASACGSYLARNATGQVAYIKRLDPCANGSLEEAQAQLEQFIY